MPLKIVGKRCRRPVPALRLFAQCHHYDRIQIARQAMQGSIDRFAPRGSNKVALMATAVAGLFADFVTALVRRDDVLAVINQQLAGVGLEVVQTRQN